MTDGNMGFQVAPITEDDMSRVHDILRRAADAIVGMSQLHEDVQSLRAQVTQTTDELSRYRRNNEALEEALSNTRQRRNELEARLSQEETARLTAQAERDDAKEALATASTNLDRVHSDLQNVKKDRDDAQFKAMELEDELQKVKAIVDNIRNVFGAMTPTVPEPTINKTAEAFRDAPPPPLGPLVQQPTEASNPPAPAPTDPVPAPVKAEPKRIYTDRWMPGSLWDENKSQYYTEARDEIPF